MTSGSGCQGVYAIWATFVCGISTSLLAYKWLILSSNTHLCFNKTLGEKSSRKVTSMPFFKSLFLRVIWVTRLCKLSLKRLDQIADSNTKYVHSQTLLSSHTPHERTQHTQNTDTTAFCAHTKLYRGYPFTFYALGGVIPLLLLSLPFLSLTRRRETIFDRLLWQQTTILSDEELYNWRIFSLTPHSSCHLWRLHELLETVASLDRVTLKNATRLKNLLLFRKAFKRISINHMCCSSSVSAS